MEKENDNNKLEAEFYKQLNLEEDAEGLEYEEDEGESNYNTFTPLCVAGRILSERVLNFQAFQQTMASVWRPVKGMLTKDLGYNNFFIQFMHEIDMKRVLDGGPWNYMQNLLILRKVEHGMDPKKMELTRVNFWIQAHNVTGYKTEKLCQDIGNSVGVFVESDPRNFSLFWREYLRIRVTIDVCKPLRRRLRLKLPEGEWNWIEFKYERLSTFCYFCGLIGHLDKYCSKLFDHPEITKEQFAYGQWMRADTRRGGSNVGDKWLLTEADVAAGVQRSPNQEIRSENQGIAGNKGEAQCQENLNFNSRKTAMDTDKDTSADFVEDEMETNVEVIESKRRRTANDNMPISADNPLVSSCNINF